MIAGIRGRAQRWIAIFVCVVAAAATTPAQTSNRQQPDAVQTGPVTEPRDAPQKPSGPPAPKGLAAIKQRQAKCSKTISVAANALFGPSRWTLQPDAATTLDVLGGLMAVAGKHPVRIESFLTSAFSDADSQSVSEKRAITVRGWLINHGFVPEGTPVEGVGKHDPALRENKSAGTEDSPSKQEKGRVDVVMDTCK